MPILLLGENLLVSICVLPNGLQETRAYHRSPLGQSKKGLGICTDKGLLFSGPTEIGPGAGCSACEGVEMTFVKSLNTHSVLD